MFFPIDFFFSNAFSKTLELNSMKNFCFSDYDGEQTAGLSGQPRMLTPPWHIYFFVKVLDCSASVLYFTFGLSGIHQEERANSCLLSDCPPVPVLELRAAMQRDENIEPGGLRANNWSIGNSPNEIRSLQKKRLRFVSYHKVARLQY